MIDFSQVVFFTAMGALLVDIVGAIYLLRLSRQSPRWVEDLISEWREGTLIDNLIGEDEETGETLIHPKADKLLNLMANKFATSIKMSLLGSKSGDVRLTKKITQDLMLDMDQSGMLGLLKTFAPNLFNTISKNPQVLQHPMVQQFLGNIASKAGNWRNNGQMAGNVMP